MALSFQPVVTNILGWLPFNRTNFLIELHMMTSQSIDFGTIDMEYVRLAVPNWYTNLPQSTEHDPIEYECKCEIGEFSVVIYRVEDIDRTIYSTCRLKYERTYFRLNSNLGAIHLLLSDFVINHIDAIKLFNTCEI